MINSNKINIRERFKFFLSKIEIREDTLCWIWNGAYDKQTGYGQIRLYDNQKTKVHRFAAYIYLGFDLNLKTNRRVVSHVCDVRRCVNPAHLKVCSQSTNLYDSVTKGRWHSGGGRNPDFINNLKQKDW